MQPMSMDSVHWICNGEIYNWKELRDRLQLAHTSQSDTSILGSLWRLYRSDPISFFRSLDGVFALVLVDEETGLVTVGRDPYGIRPLFTVSDGTSVWFASEMKALIGLAPECTIRSVSPGSYCQYTTAGKFVRSQQWHANPWIKNPLLQDEDLAKEALRISLMEAVRKRLLTERPIAALLSGGVDSSLIAALVQRLLKEMGKPPLKTFTIGFEGSADLAYARQVADWIGSDHTEIVMTADQFFDAIPQVIQHIESYDITTVRASVGNWLVSREIGRLCDAKVVFNGDGSDEVFGSYLYFFRAPADESFEAECDRLLQEIHQFDVLRSDRSISSNGLEPRTPFLDKQFVAVARSIPTRLLRPIHGIKPEKWLLRKAFEPMNLLPPAVLWRQKEAFSDGVSGTTKSWYEEIQERMEYVEVSTRPYMHVEPLTKEARYYRDVFYEYYGKECQEVIPHFWMPKWSKETKDPSARTLSLYTS